jgi:Fic family protein
MDKNVRKQFIDAKKALNEQSDFDIIDEHIEVGFTSHDRRMLERIYDVVAKAGASGGYKGGRKRALTPIGYMGESKKGKKRQ